MRRYVIAGLISGLALVATACGGGESPETTAAAPAATQAPAAGENVAVRLGESASRAGARRPRWSRAVRLHE